MNYCIFLSYVGLGLVASSLPIASFYSSPVMAQESPNQLQVAQVQSFPATFVNAKDFGALVSGKTNKFQIIAANTATIQAAIDTVGKQGGGTIYIPTGYYQVAPPNLKSQVPSSIVINYNNIALVGDGMGKTIIQSRGKWSVINGQVVRGNGILIKGTTNPANPRKNVTIKNLELSGGTTGFTGNRSFPANVTTGDGWDITHKGIVLDFNKYLDNITIDSVDVHDFRGELIYGGGNGIGKVTLYNSKLRNSNASLLSIEADITVNKSEFGKTATAWVENAPISPNKLYYFNNNTFKDSIHHGLVVAQGNFPVGHKVIITNNSFYNSPSGVNPFGGASNFIIQKNKFMDIDNALFTSGKNRNILFANNEIYAKTKPVITAHIWGNLSNVNIKNNHQYSADNLRQSNSIFYYGNLQNIVVKDNIFENCHTPQQLAALTNEHPLFQNNQYINDGILYKW